MRRRKIQYTVCNNRIQNEHVIRRKSCNGALRMMSCQRYRENIQGSIRTLFCECHCHYSIPKQDLSSQSSLSAPSAHRITKPHHRRFASLHGHWMATLNDPWERCWSTEEHTHGYSCMPRTECTTKHVPGELVDPTHHDWRALNWQCFLRLLQDLLCSEQKTAQLAVSGDCQEAVSWETWPIGRYFCLSKNRAWWYSFGWSMAEDQEQPVWTQLLAWNWNTSNTL